MELAIRFKMAEAESMLREYDNKRNTESDYKKRLRNQAEMKSQMSFKRWFIRLNMENI